MDCGERRNHDCSGKSALSVSDPLIHRVPENADKLFIYFIKRYENYISSLGTGRGALPTGSHTFAWEDEVGGRK